YLAPDLTNTYEQAGPAYLAAFLPSAGRWPTEAALLVQLQDPDQVAETGIADLGAYYERYPGARERVARRSGLTSYMPSLDFREGEVKDLIAFLKYTSLMDTEGWPPVPKVDGLTFPQASGPLAVADQADSRPEGAAAAATAVSEAAGSATAAATRGEHIATQMGCLACHATDSSRLVGTGLGGW